MTDVTRSLVDVAVALGGGDGSGLEDALRATTDRAMPREVEEVLLQSHLFIGFPRVLNAFVRWRQMSPASPADEGTVSDASGTDALAAWEARGRVVFEQVYRDQHEKVLENAERLHPDFARWMLVDGYGKVIGRKGLSLAVRELCIIALLARQDAMPQLYSHLRGALNAGAEENDVDETLVLALSHESGERSMRAREAWETVRTRRGG